MLYIFEDFLMLDFVKMKEVGGFGSWLEFLPLLLSWTGHLLQEAPGGVPRSSCVVPVLCVELDTD